MTNSGKGNIHLEDYSPGVEAIGGNEDLVREILLRLPIKSLLRFESVSKKWLSLISDHYFAQSYSRRHNPNSEPSGLLLNYEFGGFQFIPFNDDGHGHGHGDGDGDHSRVTLSYPDNSGRYTICQSCNGLLLCALVHWKENNFVDEIHICNPTTKQFSRFPTPPYEKSLVAVNLAFDPLKSPHYKLICIRFVNAYQIDIYSSETRSLRPPASGSVDPLTISEPPHRIHFTRPVYCNGAIHWISEGKTSLYFDTHTECLKTMPMPPFHEDFDFDDNLGYFGESRGHLHLIVIHEPSPVEIDILELKTDSSEWFMRYHVNLCITFPEINWNSIAIYGDLSVLCFNRAAKEEESILVLFVYGKAVSFNLKNQTLEKIFDLVPPHKTNDLASDYEWSGAYHYIETLFHV